MDPSEVAQGQRPRVGEFKKKTAIPENIVAILVPTPQSLYDEKYMIIFTFQWIVMTYL